VPHYPVTRAAPNADGRVEFFVTCSDSAGDSAGLARLLRQPTMTGSTGILNQPVASFQSLRRIGAARPPDTRTADRSPGPINGDQVTVFCTPADMP
jgi:hypothetical protein